MESQLEIYTENGKYKTCQSQIHQRYEAITRKDINDIWREFLFYYTYSS
jgi:hypothetical protein